MGIGWQGDKVRLVPLEKAKHLDNAVRWINDPEVTAWTLIGDWPMSHLAEEAWFEKAAAARDTEVHFAIETLTGEHIGFLAILNIDFRHGTGLTGTLIGPAAMRGQGYGSDAMRVRTRYAFEVLGLRMLLSEVMADNVPSLKALMRAGYRECGRIPRRWWKRGAYRDRVLLCAERDERLRNAGTPRSQDSALSPP